jgi:hypothetical protein
LIAELQDAPLAGLKVYSIGVERCLVHAWCVGSIRYDDGDRCSGDPQALNCRRQSFFTSAVIDILCNLPDAYGLAVIS